MAKIDIPKILERLDDHEKRLCTLEFKGKHGESEKASRQEAKKQPTLPEIIKNKNFKSGQEKVAVIVGYYEKIVKSKSIKQSDVKEGWKAGKFNGKYNPNLIARAIEAGLVRNIDSQLDLSQTGERFWDGFIK